jgi:hypothetical protein
VQFSRCVREGTWGKLVAVSAEGTVDFRGGTGTALQPHRAPRDATDVAGHTGLVEARIDYADPGCADTDTGRAPIADSTGLVEAGIARTRARRSDAHVADGPGLVEPRVGTRIADRAGLIDATVAGERSTGKDKGRHGGGG